MHLNNLFLILILFLIPMSIFSYGEEIPFNLIQILPNSYNPICNETDSCFEPTVLHISSGQSVKWINYDDTLHNIVSDSSINSENYFESQMLNNGDFFEFTFDNDNAIYHYFCSIHPWMNGYVVVGNTDFKKPKLDLSVDQPIIFDNFKIEKFVTGLSSPTSIDFIDDTLFILQKNDGKIKSYKNGVVNTILDLEVNNYGEQGLLGIATTDSDVYLFLTESFHDGGLSIGNKIYKFNWNGNSLIKEKLIKKLPSDGTSYIGGAMTVDNSGTLYAVSGEHYKGGVLQNILSENSYRHQSSGKILDSSNKLNIYDTIDDSISCIGTSFKLFTTNPPGWSTSKESPSTQWETNPFNIFANINECVNRFFFNEFSFGHWKDTSVILQLDPPGEYAAIGIRNSFGLTTDPITGYLWDTENGPDKYDEINLINKKFNSGWAKIQGPTDSQIISPPEYKEYVYSNPKFSWEKPIGITGLDFADSKMFEKYENWLFVADYHGNIYKFRLNEERNDLIFESEHLKDKVVNIMENSSGESESMEEILFGKNFGLVSDIEFGPDGGLYVVSLLDGTIYRIYS